jgi:hypothetical protein
MTDDVTYYVLLDVDTPPDRPLALLRRLALPGGGYADEVLRRDLAWHPTDRFRINDWNGEYVITEISGEQTGAVVDRCQAAWAAAET